MLLKKKGYPGPGKTTIKSRAILVKNPVFMLAIALLICAISALGASLVKSGGGLLTVKQLKWETPSGYMQSAQLFIPKTATKETPAPAVVVVHGWGNSGETQTPNYVELSRRGYVVLAIDMYGHGDSDNLPANTWWDDGNGANGVYDGVKLLATLPYVDISQIGIEGHSNGAYSCNRAVLLDNEADKPLISSVLLECNDAFYTKDILYAQYFDESNANYENVYGGRNVAIVAAKYDEAFHRIRLSDGTISAPRDFINTSPAQSFLNFGKNPIGLEKRNSYSIYTENIDGEDAIRVIYNPSIIHGWAYMSTRVTYDFISFFQKTMPAPNPIAGGNQIWPWKIFFEAIGVIGILLFLVNFILVLLETRFFGVLKAQKPVLPTEVNRKGKAWLWGGLTINALFSAISFPIVWIAAQVFQPSWFNQWHPWVLGWWSLINGLFTLLILFLNYRRYAKVNGLNLRERGVILSRDKIWKTILLGILAVFSTYFVVFVANYFFTTDFRLWDLLTFKSFDAVKIPEILKFTPFFVIFYIINSIAMNVFNYVKIGKKEWINTLLMCICNTLGVIILLVVFYSYFLNTGLLPTDCLSWGLGTMIMWVYPMAATLPIATVINRFIYKKTCNPYISSIAFSLIVAIMICTTTLTYLIK
ncbi:alpha/beta hydrolase family protein [Anaerocolumna jejuensis]|uniref:alpha/beta hydrolase family protein n=1 Tax=Anaerocolumna jejuensis TaxID=259063 RepID=UPI003F7CB735